MDSTNWIDSGYLYGNIFVATGDQDHPGKKSRKHFPVNAYRTDDRVDIMDHLRD